MKDLIYKEGHDYGGSTHADYEVSIIDAKYEQQIRALDLNDPDYRGKVEALTQKRNNDVARAQAAYSAQQEGRQQQLSQLEEQLDYSWYYYINDIQNRADFKKNSKGSEEAVARLKSRGGVDFGFYKNVVDEDLQKKYAKQIATYYYLYDNVSAESADAYLDYIMPVVRQANGEEMAEAVNYPVLRELIAMGAGIESGFTGLVNWALDEPIADSNLQYGTRKIQKDLYESDSWWDRTVAKWATNAAQSAGNMVPGLIASAIDPKLALFVFGTSAAGSAYKEYRDAGVDENNALLGGALRGLSEVFTQKLLGGLQIPGFSGIFTGKAADVLGSKVGSALGKAAVTWGVGIVSEAIEENAQNYIEPAINLLIGAADKYEAPGWDEFIDTTMSTVFLTGVMNAPSAVSNAKKIKSDMQFTKEVINPWIDEALSNGEKFGASEQVALAKELKEQIDGGKVIDPQDFGLRLMEAIAQDAAANAGTATNREDLFVAGRAQASTPQEQSAAQQTEQRAELVQENNPEAEVVKSHGTQLYLNAGTDLATAQSAGAVLDGILSGEITSENMSGKQADKLRLYKPYAARLVSDALGVELQATETKAQARAAAKAAVLAYEQRIKAVATQENNAPSSVQQSVNTSFVRNDIAAQPQETASAVVPEVQEQNSAPRPAAEPAEQEALQMQSEQNSTRGDFYAQLPTEEGASTAPAGAMSYEDFKYRMRTDKEFRNRYTDEGAKGLSQEARNLRAYDLYQDRMGQMQSAAGTLSRTRFAEAYREINATKKNPAQDTEVDLAYQDYLEMQQDRTVTEAEQDAVPEDYIGLVENELSEAVPQEVREAVDALAKQFGLQISYEDIGSDNGYYIPGTNRVVLDINPVRSAVDDAGRSAYLFTVAHEVGHYARENMSEEAWESFEAHAVAAMGGETAVSAKMQEEDADGNSIYNTEALAREDVACDFLGKILSDKAALKQFCDAIRDRTVSQPAARGILGAIRKVLAKLAGNKAAKRSEASVQQSVAKGLELFAEDIEAGRKAASEIADALAELAKQPRPLMNSKQAEAILAEAKKSNKEAARKTSGTQSNIDNAADLTYNKNENENGGERYDSNRMDRGLAEGVPVRQGLGRIPQERRVRGTSENGRGHQGVLRRNLSKSLSRAFNESGVVAAELYSFDGDRAAFSSALDAAREADAKNGWCVTPQSVEDLSGKLTFMDGGSTIGFVVTDSGDIEGVFKNPEKNKTRRAMDGVIPQAIAAGGTKLDCYGVGLVKIYENYGFIPVARVEFNEKYANPGWDASKGKPDIFFMMHNGDSAETVVSKIGTYPHMSEEQLNSLPRYGKDGYDEAMAYRDGLLDERNNASEAPDADIRRSRKDSAEFTQNDVKVSVSATKDGYSLDVDGEKSEFVWKRGIDGARQVLYNKSGKRSAALQEVVQRLHSGEAVPVEEVMSLPEVELANKLSEADATFNLPNREAIRKAGYEKAMSLGSYNSKTGKLDGRILRERRMDVVIGLPGSGKSSVYSNRLSEEHGERIIDTDDFREYIPDYNGLNASVVHQEASLMRDMVLDEATQRGENILLSTVGANAKSLANKIRDYTSDGYSVYLHLNELPYLESVARVLERYVGKDGKLGRIVRPNLVYTYKNAPTDVYLEITGQEGNVDYDTRRTAETGLGKRGMGRPARARDVRTETERTRTGEERSAGKGENDVSDLLSGFDWYNNNVKYGEEPIVVQANREAPIQRMSDVRRSRKNRQNETERVPRLPTRQEAEEILRRSREEQKAREIAEEARREASRRAFIENAPARRKSAKNTQLEDLVAKHGAIPPGENPVRDVAVPNRTTVDTKVRRTVRTALEAEVTADSLVPVIEDSIVARNFDYKPKKNQRTVEEAHKWLETHKSAKAAYKAWLSDKSRHLNADMIARGFVLYNTFATAANQTENATERRELQENAVDILHDISVMGTVAGQTAQAIRLLKQQTPDAQYYALERAVARLQSDINERFGEKKAGAPQIVIDKDLAGKWIQALRQGKTEQANDLETLLYQSIAAQVPKTVYDRINAWRYLAMLGNPKTLIRNAVGNLAFTPMAVFKDQIGAALERIFLPKEQRTKYAGVRSFTKEGRELLKYADMDIESSEVQQMLSTRKYDDTNVNDRLGRAIAEKKSTFTLPGLKHWQAATRYVMEKMPFAGDDFYKGLHYKRSFASAAMARGYTAEDFRSGRVSENERWEIRAYAAKQAAKATFNDANMVSNFVRRWRFKNKAANMLVEGVVPFKGTPANLLVRSVEYGPVGLLKAITADVYFVKTGRITGQEYIDRISSGLTGTALAGLGYLLAALGVIRVNADDDDEREGKQTYSLEMFGKSITLDWLSPSAIPLFMGAEINELMNGEGYESFADALIDTSSDFFAPILEMSMLSGAKDLLDNFVYAYSDGADAGTVIASLFVQPFFSYLGQFLPTIMSQTANALEPNRTTTYVGDISGKWARSFVRNVAKLTEKIPFVDWRQIDYVDDWGNVESNGGLLARFFNSFINPAYVNDIVVTDVDAEIARIKEENGSNIAPERRKAEIVVSVYDDEGTKISSEKVKLNGDQYGKYQREYGKQYALMAASLMASDYYDELSDSDRVKAFEEIESLADEFGKLAADVGYVIEPGSNDDKLYTLTELGMPVAEAYAARLLYRQLNRDEDIKPTDKYERFRTWVLDNEEWTDEEKTAVIDTFGKFSSGFVVSSENYDELISSGTMDASTASSITEGVRALKPQEGKEDVSDYQKYEYILGRTDLNAKQRDAALVSYMNAKEKERYDACAATGVSATTYITVLSDIHNLTPLAGRDGVTSAQKWEVCIKAVSSEEQQDALLNRYMDTDQAAKYEKARSAGVAPKLYVKYCDAKYTYGDGNGSWTQAELQSWLDANVSSTSQKAVLWELTNSGWKNNPYR